MGSGGWVLSIEEAAALVVGSGGLIGDGLSGELAGAFDVELNLADGDEDEERSPGEGVKGVGGVGIRWGEEEDDEEGEDGDGEEDDEEGEDDDISD